MGADARVMALPGGVSNDVYLIHSASGDLVVKHPLPRLRVADEWRADTSRVVREGLALQTFGRLTPGCVPPVIDLDVDAEILTLAYAPSSWRDWRAELLDGRAAEPWIAAELGRVAGTWHRATSDGTGVSPELVDQRSFRELRLDPYHGTVASRHLDLREPLEAVTDELRVGSCLVHGDFSPKNVLVGRDQLWVLDAEVAHVGDPVFDLAFLHSHLILKSVARPALGSALAACARAFDDSYAATSPETASSARGRLTRHLGALLLARVDGRSPADYLSADEQVRVRELGRAALCDGVDPWTVVVGTSRPGSP